MRRINAHRKLTREDVKLYKTNIRVDKVETRIDIEDFNSKTLNLIAILQIKLENSKI